MVPVGGRTYAKSIWVDKVASDQGLLVIISFTLC